MERAQILFMLELPGSMLLGPLGSFQLLTAAHTLSISETMNMRLPLLLWDLLSRS